MHVIIEYFIGVLYLLFGKNVRIIPFSRIDKNSKFGLYNYVGRHSIIKNTSIGKFSYIGSDCIFTNSSIGNFCSISSNVQVVSGKHPSSIWVSSHPVFYSILPPTKNSFVKKQLFEEFVLTANGKSCEIGNDVWIGRNVIIMEGVIIGDGAIIATGSIVTKDIAPYTIVGGIPAKVIRRRFNEDQCKKLHSIEWWNWSDEELRSKAHDFSDIDIFLKNNSK